MIGRTARDIVCPDDPPPPVCADCGRQMCREGGGCLYRCPECKATITDNEIERLQAWHELEEAIRDIEHAAGCSVVSTAAVLEAVEVARERMATVEACLVSEGVKVE